MKKPPASEVFKDYKPEIITYDPAVDFGDEWLERDKHLSEKEKLIEKIMKGKRAKKGNKTTYRAPIRTENLKGTNDADTENNDRR